MDNKKRITIAVIVLILVAGGLALTGKFKEALKNRSAVKNKPITNVESVATEGVVTNVSGGKMTIQTETGEKTVAIQPDAKIYVKDENGMPVETNASELKKDAETIVIQNESVTRTKVLASNIVSGTVLSIEGPKITLQTAEGEKAFSITSETSIYMEDGDQVTDKQISDIREGSEITVAYADTGTQLQVVGIRIDQL